MSQTTDGGLPNLVHAWKPLVAAATWIVATFCSSLTFSIKISATSDLDGNILACANALVAVVVGLISLFALRASASLSGGFWLRMSLSCGTLFVLSFFLFMVMRAEWTCQYVRDVRLVIGSVPSPNLAEYLQNLGGSGFVSCTTLLGDYGGDTERMYATTDLVRRFASMVSVFFVMWCSLSATVVGIAYGIAGHPRKPPQIHSAQP